MKIKKYLTAFVVGTVALFIGISVMFQTTSEEIKKIFKKTGKIPRWGWFYHPFLCLRLKMRI